MSTELTKDALERDIRDYETLLGMKVPERVLHAFIAQRNHVFGELIRLLSLAPLYSHVKLGADHEVDLAWCDNRRYGLEWRFVEIESPVRPMFTKADEPSKWLRHAIQQCQDWHDWITRNLRYAQQLLPAVEYPRCYVFVGIEREHRDERVEWMRWEAEGNIELRRIAEALGLATDSAESDAPAA